MKSGFLICHGTGEIFGAKNRRLTFQDKGAPEKKESAKPEEKKGDVAQQKFDAAKKSLQTAIQKALTSPSAAVKKAAMEAQKQLNALGKGKESDLAKIEANITRIQGILDYFEFEKCRGDIRDALKKNEAALKKTYQAEVDQFLKDYPKLTPDLKNKLKAANQHRTEKMAAAYEKEFLPKEDMTLDKFLADPSAAQQISAKFMENRTVLLQSGAPNEAETGPIQQEYQIARDAIMFTQIALDNKESASYVERDVANVSALLDGQKKSLQAQLESDPDNAELKQKLAYVENSILKLPDLQKNTLALIGAFHYPEDATKRALIIGHFEDELDKLLTKDYAESRYFDATIKMTGFKKDAIALGFEKGKAEFDSSLANKVGVFAYVKIGSDFRMDGTGIELAGNTRPNMECTVMDELVYTFEGERGRPTMRYMKVQVNPPDGPIGYIPKDSLDIPGYRKDRDAREEKRREKESGKDKFASMGAIKKLLIDVGDDDAFEQASKDIEEDKDSVRQMNDLHTRINNLEESKHAPELKQKMHDWLEEHSNESQLAHMKKYVERAGGIDEVTVAEYLDAVSNSYLEMHPELGEKAARGELNLNTLLDDMLNELEE